MSRRASPINMAYELDAAVWVGVRIRVGDFVGHHINPYIHVHGISIVDVVEISRFLLCDCQIIVIE